MKTIKGKLASITQTWLAFDCICGTPIGGVPNGYATCTRCSRIYKLFKKQENAKLVYTPYEEEDVEYLSGTDEGSPISL
jgi:orotate phosphoribosyltransferase